VQKEKERGSAMNMQVKRKQGKGSSGTEAKGKERDVQLLRGEKGRLT